METGGFLYGLRGFFMESAFFREIDEIFQRIFLVLGKRKMGKTKNEN